MKNVSLLIFSSIIVSAFTGAAQPDTNVVRVTPMLVDQLLRRARTNNPALAAAHARVDAAKYNSDAVRIWQDPMVSVAKMAAPREMMREEGDLVLEVEQPLPLFGKEKLQREAAKASADVEIANASYRDRVLRRDLLTALLRSAVLEREAQIATTDLEWIDLIATTARQRYALGTSAQTDVLRLQTEEAKRADEVRTTTNNLARERAVINRLLNLPLNAFVPRLDLPDLADALPSTPALVAFAAQADPKTTIMRRQIREAEAMTTATRRMRLPDVFVAAEANRYTGDASFKQGMVKIGLNIPWFNSRKYESDIKREEARVRAAESDLADYQLELRDEIVRLTTAIDNSRRSTLVYREQVIPRAEQSLTSALTNWEANRGSFIDVLDTRRMLLEAQLSAVRAIAEQHQMLADLLLLLAVDDPNALQQLTSAPADQPSTTAQP